jgi:DNA-binding NarL/FixJ family response regulator
LVADDHPVVRDGLVAVLGTQPDFEVVGEAATGTEVVEQVRALQPDVVLLDLEMPELDGVAALQQLRTGASSVHAVVFTAFDTDERIVSALQAGAQGYLLKGAPRNEIFRAIRVVHAGGSLLEPVVASRLIDHLQRTDDTNLLTEREREVLALLAQGKSNKAIAATLVITERTAKFHVSSIMRKLGASNRTEAVTIAAQQGLVRVTSDE